MSSWQNAGDKNMKLKSNNILILLAVCFPALSWAWGNSGHRIVAKIAYSQLLPSVKDSVNKYLGLAHIEDAGTWMDEVRSDPAYNYMSTWHYINLDKGQSYSPDSTDNIIWATNRAIDQLKHRNNYSKDQTAVNLKILFHLVGDLHQPLHVGYGVDRGGNSIPVFISNSPSNLHRVWDTDIIEAYIMGHPTNWADLSKYSKEQLADIRHVDILHWLDESRSKLGTVYDFKGDNMNQKYIDRNVPVIEEQLLLAGVRLASLLNQIFTQPAAKL